jgi:hypothetical protein
MMPLLLRKQKSYSTRKIDGKILSCFVYNIFVQNIIIMIKIRGNPYDELVLLYSYTTPTD